MQEEKSLTYVVVMTLILHSRLKFEIVGIYIFILDAYVLQKFTFHA